MGTGLFSYPWIASNTGLASLIIYIVVGGMFSLYAMYLLMSVSQPNNIKTYNELAELAYGKVLKRISEFCVVFYAWGITICFQVVFAKFVVEIISQIFDSINLYQPGSRTEFNSTGNIVRLVTNTVAILVNLIFIFKKDLYSLRFITILGTMAVIYNTLIIFVTALTGFDYEKGDVKYHYESILSKNKDWSGLRWFNFDNPWLQLVGFANTIFCYVNHQMIFPMADELVKPSKRRLHKIFDRAHFTEGIIYLLVGLMGYLLLFEQSIDSVVLQSITTIPMLIGKLSQLRRKMPNAHHTVFCSASQHATSKIDAIYFFGNLKEQQKSLYRLSYPGTVELWNRYGFPKGHNIFRIARWYSRHHDCRYGNIRHLGTIPAMCYLKLTPRPMSDIRCIAVLVLYSIMTICGFVGAFAAVFAVK